jgi:hypothetical protein
VSNAALDLKLGPVTEGRFSAAFSTRAVVDKATAAKLIGLDVKTLDALSDARVIRAVRKGAHRAYTERDLRLYLIEGPDIECEPDTPTTNNSPKPRPSRPASKVVNFSERRNARGREA